MKQPLLVIFIGVPGSGKTYFAEKLASRIRAVLLNADAMRLAIFGSLDDIDKTYHSSDRQMLNTHTFGAMDYATKQVLALGIPVIYETIQRTQADRRHMEQLAKEAGAGLVLVSMIVDKETAIARVQERQSSADVRTLTRKKARETVEHFSDNLEPLELTDYVIEIDGTMPFEEQYKTFQVFLAQ